MTNNSEILNRFLVEVFNKILKSERESITKSGYQDLSIQELHVIESVCLCQDEGKNTSKQISAHLGIVPGTLTVSVNILVKKGYLIRIKDEADKRVVNIRTTKKGDQANREHKRFHEQMVNDILQTLTSEEAAVLIQALGTIRKIFI